MFDVENESSSAGGIKIGRIVFCVLTALPVATFMNIIFFPGTTKEEQFTNFMLGILALSMSLILTVIGSVIVIYMVAKRSAIIFWPIALFFAAFPLLYWLAAIVAEALVGRPVMLR